MPAAITGVVATCAVTGTGSCGTNGTTGNNVSFTNASLPAGAGQELTITIVGTVGPGTTGNLVNTATVTAGAGQTDTASGNNSATDTDTQGAGRGESGDHEDRRPVRLRRGYADQLHADGDQRGAVECRAA